MLTFNTSYDGGTFEESANPLEISPANMVVGERYFLDKCFDISGVLIDDKESISFTDIKGQLGHYELCDKGFVRFGKYTRLPFYTYNA